MNIRDKASKFVERWVPRTGRWGGLSTPGRYDQAKGELAKLMRLVFRAGMKEEHPGMDRGTVFGETFEDVEAVLLLCDEQDMKLKDLPRRFEDLKSFRNQEGQRTTDALERVNDLCNEACVLKAEHAEEIKALEARLKEARSLTVRDSHIENLNVTDGTEVTMETTIKRRPSSYRRSTVHYSLEPRDDCQYLQDLSKPKRGY